MKLIHFVILLFLLAIYVLGINFISKYNYVTVVEEVDDGPNTPENRIGLSDTVTVTVKQDRFFYNKETYITNSAKSSTLFIFGFIPLPLVVDNISFFYAHMIFFLACLFYFLSVVFYIIFDKDERGYITE